MATDSDPSVILEISSDDAFYQDDCSRIKNGRNRHKKTSVICVMCYKVLANQEEYEAHMKSFHPSVSDVSETANVITKTSKFPCPDCKEMFGSLKALEVHSKKQHAQAWSLQCTICGEYSTTSSSSDNGIFFCAKCNLISMPLMSISSNDSSPKKTEIDYSTNFTTENFNCSRCSQQFISKIELRDHQISEHPKHYTGYLCRHKRCNMKFYKYDLYIRHLDEHKLKHMCEHCDKLFSTIQTLRQHMRTHTGEKPFQCTECGRAFAVKDYLTKHIRIHTGEKPYECRQCKARFTQQTAKNLHMKKCPVRNVRKANTSVSVQNELTETSE